MRQGVMKLLKYKMDILKELKLAGYNTTRLRKEKLLSESTIQKLRTGQIVDNNNINRLCSLLECQPGDILVHIPDESDITD